MALNIVIPDSHTLNPGDLSWEPIQALGAVSIYDRTPASLLVKRCLSADIILPNKVLLDAKVIAELPHLKYIGITATGYNNVDLEAAAARNIKVSNVQGYGTASVAQHTFALILALTNKAAAHHQAVLQGQWGRSPDFCFWNSPLVELANKKIGIIGYGKIGQQVAKIALGFGMKVLVYHKRPIEMPFEADMLEVDLEELFTESDVVSLHLPLTKETKELVNRQYLNLMKKTAYLINTSRGSLIHENDLFDVLMNGGIAGAGLDVLSEEPPGNGNVLLGAPNCVITPHNAWSTKASRMRLIQTLAENIQSFIKGAPQNIIV